MNRPREHNFLAAFLLVLCFLLAQAVLRDLDERQEERAARENAERIQRARDAIWGDLDASGRRMTGYDHIKSK